MGCTDFEVCSASLNWLWLLFNLILLNFLKLICFLICHELHCQWTWPVFLTSGSCLYYNQLLQPCFITLTKDCPIFIYWVTLNLEHNFESTPLFKVINLIHMKTLSSHVHLKNGWINRLIIGIVAWRIRVAVSYAAAISCEKNFFCHKVNFVGIWQLVTWKIQTIMLFEWDKKNNRMWKICHWRGSNIKTPELTSRERPKLELPAPLNISRGITNFFHLGFRKKMSWDFGFATLKFLYCT